MVAHNFDAHVVEDVSFFFLSFPTGERSPASGGGKEFLFMYTSIGTIDRAYKDEGEKKILSQMIHILIYVCGVCTCRVFCGVLRFGMVHNERKQNTDPVIKYDKYILRRK